MWRKIIWSGVVIAPCLAVLAWTYSAGGFKEMAWDGRPVNVIGPPMGNDVLKKVCATGTKKAQVVQKLGNPIHEIAETTGSILIYRNVTEVKSGSGYFFGMISTGKYYTSYETILLLELLDGHTGRCSAIGRTYLVPGKDIEFGLDDTAFDGMGFAISK